jgi:phospholipase D1/2
MAGEPYKVGRFAHTLRVRLMREHLGVDVDRFEAQGVSSQMTSDDQDQAVSPLSSDRVSNDVDADADGVTKLESGAVDRSSADVISNQAEEKDHLPPLSSHRRSNTTSALPRNRKDKFGPYSVPAIDEIDPYGFEDPLSDEFYQDVFLANAIRNTQCYRKVFRSIPDE